MLRHLRKLRMTRQRLFSDPVTLNAWCEKWLSREQWQQLKTAARAAQLRRMFRRNMVQSWAFGGSKTRNIDSRLD